MLRRRPPWGATMYDSAGVTVVVNPETGIWANGEGWRLEEEVRIGTVEHPRDGALGSEPAGRDTL